MRHRERGLTFLGWLFVLVPVGMVLYAGIRLTPVYLEYMKIARTLEQVREQYKGDTTDATALRVAIERRFDIEDVTVISKNDIRIVREGNGYTVEASYEATAPYIGDVSLLVTFNKVVTVE